jgi:hypothetical protein
MRNWIIGIAIALVTAGLGVGAAYGAKTLVQQNAPAIRSAAQDARGAMQTARGDRPGQPYGAGPMSRMRQSAPLTMDEAVQTAQSFLAKSGNDWKIDKVLQFQNAFDVIFVEKETGRGAAQLLIPATGRGMQRLPELQWNLKYGPAGESRAAASGATDNTVAIADARTAAQAYLAKAQPGATLLEGGYAFYGYYLFEYSVDGKTAGIVLVNGLTSEAGQLKMLGSFVAEKEMAQ